MCVTWLAWRISSRAIPNTPGHLFRPVGKGPRGIFPGPSFSDAVPCVATSPEHVAVESVRSLMGMCVRGRRRSPAPSADAVGRFELPCPWQRAWSTITRVSLLCVSGGRHRQIIGDTLICTRMMLEKYVALVITIAPSSSSTSKPEVGASQPDHPPTTPGRRITGKQNSDPPSPQKAASAAQKSGEHVGSKVGPAVVGAEKLDDVAPKPSEADASSEAALAARKRAQSFSPAGPASPGKRAKKQSRPATAASTKEKLLQDDSSSDTN